MYVCMSIYNRGSTYRDAFKPWYNYNFVLLKCLLHIFDSDFVWRMQLMIIKG